MHSVLEMDQLGMIKRLLSQDELAKSDEGQWNIPFAAIKHEIRADY